MRCRGILRTWGMRFSFSILDGIKIILQVPQRFPSLLQFPIGQSKWNLALMLTYCLDPRAFRKERTFWRFSGWIRAKLAPIYSRRHLQHDSMPFFPLASRFMKFLLGHAQKSKFLDEKVTYVFRLFVFLIFLFFTFPFSRYLIFLLQWLTFYRACFQFKAFWESIIETGNFYHGVATCSRRKFCCEIFTQIAENFRAYFRLHWADHSDLGVIGKIFSSFRSWVWMTPSLAKGDDFRSGTKAKPCHSSMG